ncbi:MAG: type II secretion system protein [Myxococcales bacterium]|nr:type II secretion system protein [Myxococcales bacterium]
MKNTLPAGRNLPRRLARAQRGVTLLEVMMSMGVIIIGMLGLYKALNSATGSSALANRFSQAQARGQQVIEAIRKAPATPTNIPDCLASAATAASWANCEALCKAALGLNAAADSCVFTTLANAKQDVDRSGQLYQVVFDAADPAGRTSQVITPPNVVGAPCMGVPCPLYDVQVTIGWNDSGLAAPSSDPNLGGHRVSVRQVVWR